LFLCAEKRSLSESGDATWARRKPPVAGSGSVNDGIGAVARRGRAVPGARGHDEPGGVQPGSSAHRADAKRQMIRKCMIGTVALRAYHSIAAGTACVRMSSAVR
jgi:hypothetical protein